MSDPAASSEAPAKRPRPSKTSGLFVLLWIIGGGLLFFGIVLAFAAWKIASDPEGRAGAGAVWEGVRTMWSAKSAPGTRELRKAGCDQALALPMTELNRVLSMADAGVRRMPPITLVTCSASLLRKAPTCEALARVYAGAVPNGPPFMVVIQKPAAGDVCKGTFLGDGKPVSEPRFYLAAQSYGGEPKTEVLDPRAEPKPIDEDDVDVEDEDEDEEPLDAGR